MLVMLVFSAFFIRRNTMESQPKTKVSNAIDPLSYEEIRQACINHFRYLPYINLGNFKQPDPEWIKEEGRDIRNRLRLTVPFNETDLWNAFYSVVFELEFKKVFHPGSLIYTFYIDDSDPTIYRLDRFKNHCRAIATKYLKNSGGKLGKSQDIFLPSFKLLAVKDPLIKQ